MELQELAIYLLVFCPEAHRHGSNNLTQPMHEHLGKLFQHTFTTLGDDVKSFPLCQTLYHSEANTEANVQE